jgi:hypothetical protein
MPIGEFLESNALVKQQAEGEKPIDWIAGQFLPDAEMAEGYQDWIARQAVQILQAALIEDAMRDGSHLCRKVSAMEIAPEDRAWLFAALGHHPEVLATWRPMAMDAIAA